VTLAAGTRLGPYEIVAPLGSGGMGVVYRAVDTRLRRPVAVKVLKDAVHLPAHAVERFTREAQTASALNHPNICTVYDVGADPPFIAMELLEGETLHQRLARERLDLAAWMSIGLAIADALAAAHLRGIVHRDIKPANIFLTARGPKILDFGLAKPESTASLGASGEATRPPEALLTDSGATVGTIAYMAPEQLTGSHVDARSDLFSVGLVLYEMATGRPAFTGKTSAAISGAILYEAPIPPRQLRPNLPIHAEDIILKALEKDRDDRYQTAGDLRADLHRLQREVSANPPSAAPDAVEPRRDAAVRYAAASSSDVQLARALMMRHRTLVGIAAAALVLALGVGTYVALKLRSRAADQLLRNLEVEQITRTGDAQSAAVTPDGNYAVYVRHQDSGHSLHVQQTKSAAAVEIVHPESGVALLGATVAPDAVSVDYVRRVTTQPFELWRVPLLGGAPRKLREGVTSRIGWSPDGREFAFVRTDVSRGTTSLVVTDAEGSQERVLAQRQRPAQFVSLMIATRPGAAPAWSSDGRMVAVLGFGGHGTPAQSDLDIVDVRTGAERILDLPGDAALGVDWLDDGTLILNASNGLDRPLQFFRLSLADGRLSAITNDLSRYLGLSITSDRRTFVTSRNEGRSDLWILDRDGTTAAHGQATTVGESVNWIGNRTLYQGVNAIVSAWTPGEAPRELLKDTGHASASRDGKTVVAVGFPPRASGLWKIAGDGGPATLLVPGDAFYPTIAADNRTVIFLSARTGQQELWSVPLEGGTPSPLTSVYVAAPGADISPDGKSMVVPSRGSDNRAATLICDLPACTNQRTLPVRGVGRVRWAPGGQAIDYIEAATQRNIWRLPLGGGAPSQLTHFEDRTISDFAWSPDGRLALARTTIVNDIVLFRNVAR